MAAVGSKKKVEIKEEVVGVDVSEPVIETPKERVFKEDELLPCISVTAGELLMIGQKSGTLYKWGDIDAIEYVEYRDLYREAQQRTKYLYGPYFIVDDEDFNAKFKELDIKFKELYSKDKLLEMLEKCSGDLLKTNIENLPKSIKETFKHIVSGMVSSGEFDSSNKIKIIDEALGTQLMLKLT